MMPPRRRPGDGLRGARRRDASRPGRHLPKGWAVERPDCLACRSFYVTWDPALPRGCRAFGFRSQALPAAVVSESSGRECDLFERRPRPARPAGSAPGAGGAT